MSHAAAKATRMTSERWRREAQHVGLCDGASRQVRENAIHRRLRRERVDGRTGRLLQPDEKADLFTARLEANTYSVRWHSVGSRETRDAGKVTVENHGNTTFTAPFAKAGPAVLYLKGVGR